MLTITKSQTVDSIRLEADSEVKGYVGKPRFGLFSSPKAGAVGNPTEEVSLRPKRDASGKIITQPRGIMASKSKSTLFSDIGYLCVGDPYIEPDRIERQYQLKKKEKEIKGATFKPACVISADPYTALYKSEPENEITDTPAQRSKSQNKKLSPRGIFTSPAKGGHYLSTSGHLFSPTKYHLDPYDAHRMEEIKRKKEAMKSQKSPFYAGSPGGKPINTNIDTFGIDMSKFPEVKKDASTPKRTDSFKPPSTMKSSVFGTINPFPEHKPDPIHQATRKVETKSATSPAFKPVTSITSSRPTPSISLNKYNLKKELSGGLSLHMN